MFDKKEYFYAPIVEIDKLNACPDSRIFIPSPKGEYLFSVSRYVSVKINEEIYDFFLSATNKTLQDVIDLEVGDQIMCFKKGNCYWISEDLVKHKVIKKKMM